ncbi:MAG: hypothetical protein CVV24_15045 [Ignavibacteriae bacterium HGW-Ignavibacteriae-3]|nr:MAG: hypothetical protein CVV24_15045 [Ignavibacteriae bacterium HGW-Ignavibacteriae-3]
MTSKIVEVLAKILEGLGNNSTLEEVNRSLMKSKQFDKQTLGIAYSLIYDKVLSKKMLSLKGESDIKKGFRFLSDSEKETLGVENYSYLLHLINVGLLEAENFEIILDQIAIFPDSRVTRREINWIILLSLVEFDSEVLPGSRMLLYSSDTVN